MDDKIDSGGDFCTRDISSGNLSRWHEFGFKNLLVLYVGWYGLNTMYHEELVPSQAYGIENATKGSTLDSNEGQDSRSCLSKLLMLR